MKFQSRDGDLLLALYRYDGMLARRQIKALFWPQASQRAMEMRLLLLFRHRYLDYPDRDQRRTQPTSEPVCWLGWKGALWVASQFGIAVDWPQKENETALRKVAHGLKQYDFRWLREPRWSQIAHDVAVTDIRMAVQRAIIDCPGLTLETWIGESDFRADMDVVEYAVTGSNGNVIHKKRGVRPDGYFVLADEYRQRQGLPARARFLLEVDMGTHDIGSFFEEKVLAGMAYLHSAAYRQRFGDNTGRWLVVAKGEKRLGHLLAQAARIEADMFWFATLAEVSARNPLIAPVWCQPHTACPQALIVR